MLLMPVSLLSRGRHTRVWTIKKKHWIPILLVKEDNPELNKTLGNFYLSAGNLVLAVLHWKRYLETSPQEGKYFLIQKRFQFFSQQLRMKSLEKQIFDLSGEQTRALYKIYRNMKVELGP